jgi:hypothetical protein
VYGITIVAFTQKYLGYHIFLREQRYIPLASSSKDNPRVEIESGVELDSYSSYVLRVAILYF